MNNKIFFTLLTVVLLSASCSVRRYLPAGERIYKGASAVVTKNPEEKAKVRSLKKQILLAAKPTPNKFLLGQPYKVWWWYKIGEPKREKGFKAFLRNKLGEPPVFSSRLNAVKTAENMASLMHNLGYFRTTVQGDTVNFSYFTKAKYTAQVEPQYTIKKIEWVSDSTNLLKLLEADASANGFLKVGNAYRLSDISAERDRLDLYLKTQGDYYFNPDYLMAYADSSIGGRGVALLLNIKKIIPEDAKLPYTINSVTLYPNYSLAQGEPDTGRVGRESFDRLLIQDSSRKFKKSLFGNMVTYRPGEVYDSRLQNSTLNRLINLGAFKFVKNRFEESKEDTADNRSLDVFYYLTPAPKKSLQAQIDGFTKENNFIGSQVSANWRNRNAFRGAEQLAVKAYAGIETTSGNAVKNDNYRLGTDVSLKIPRYVIPFFNIKETNFYPPTTTVLLGYEWFRRNLLYTKNLFKFNYEFSWKRNIRNQFTVAPIALSYLSVTKITDSFTKQLAVNPSLRVNVLSEATIGSYFGYSYNSGNRSAKNIWFFASGLDLSGNALGLITGAKDYRSKTILGTPFAQYFKLDADVHYTRKLKGGIDIANRFLIGVGVPYNNSRILPFGKLYTIGGSNSLRGFRARTLGPGKHLPSNEDQRFFQIIGGDYKLLANTEVRLPITKQISTAFFIDAGNIWNKDTLLFGPEGKFTKDFMKEIAVSSGVGVRFDAVVLLIRADLGIPLRKPYLPEAERWVINQINFGSKAWRRDNLILNIAIGLPF